MARGGNNITMNLQRRRRKYFFCTVVQPLICHSSSFLQVRREVIEKNLYVSKRAGILTNGIGSESQWKWVADGKKRKRKKSSCKLALKMTLDFIKKFIANFFIIRKVRLFIRKVLYFILDLKHYSRFFNTESIWIVVYQFFMQKYNQFWLTFYCTSKTFVPLLIVIQLWIMNYVQYRSAI